MRDQDVSRSSLLCFVRFGSEALCDFNYVYGIHINRTYEGTKSLQGRR